MNLRGKNIIITGSNRGIGHAMVECFAKSGANIWAHARRKTEDFERDIFRIAEENSVEIWPLYFDLTNEDSMKREVMAIRKTKKPVDVLVNNAGITYNALFQMSSESQLREQFEVNFFAVYRLTQYISKLMVRQKRGNIVNVASTAALDGNSGKSVYGATKAAIITMTNCIAEELGESGIRANCIAPGVTRTDMLSTMPEEAINESVLSSDLQSEAMPIDIANTAVFLASDASSYITGQVIRVDGGMH